MKYATYIFKWLLIWKKKVKKITGISLYVSNEISITKINDLVQKCEVYLEHTPQVKKIKNKYLFYLFLFFDNQLILIGDHTLYIKNLKYLYNVDPEYNPNEAWVWHTILYEYFHNEEDLIVSKNKFYNFLSQLPTLDKCYLLGTGPSLDQANTLIKNDGYVVVCNTIVKDFELCSNLKPDIIVAGDALYHFGTNLFATAFRRDLKKILASFPEMIFVYPALFHPYIKKEFSIFQQQLYPVPISSNLTQFVSLREKFQLPSLGNVLNLLLLPLGVTLSKKIYLLGFDGRAPDDKYFWSNSSKHFYPEEFQDLLKKNKAFFNYFVPNSNPTNYVNQVHGNTLNDRLEILERNGYQIFSLNPSFTDTINARYLNYNINV